MFGVWDQIASSYTTSALGKDTIIKVTDWYIKDIIGSNPSLVMF